MSLLIGCFAWFVIGTVLALHYCLLAGWDWEVFAPMTIALPAMAIIWLIIGALADIVTTKPLRIYWKNAFRRSNPNISRIPLAIFWTWTTYCLLPLIIHGIALLMARIGLEKYADSVYAYRYAILRDVVFGAIFIFFIVIMLGGLSETVHRIRTAKPTRKIVD